MRFSQRIGKSPATKLAQREAIDQDLTNSLWNALTIVYWDSYEAPGLYSTVRGSNLYPLVSLLWIHLFKQPVDTIDQYWTDCLSKLRTYFFKAAWYQVFDFIEFAAEHGGVGRKSTFIQICNNFLERENSAYRFVNEQITEITSDLEIQEVERALENSQPFAGARIHLSTALTLLSNRTSPDYRNSIKESISAVESLAKQISGGTSATLGAVLKELEKSHALHPALKAAFSSLYGYTSDSNGIRHALMDEITLTKADAKFMLVCCSAFVNYVIEVIKKR